MKRFIRPLVTIVGFVVVGSVMSLVTHKNAVAQNPQNTTPVRVVNTTPIPVSGNVTSTIAGQVAATITNTPSVSIANTPTVTGTVSVGNTPTVTVGNTPTVSVSNFPAAQPVSFSNTSTTPLFVENIADSNPYQNSCGSLPPGPPTPTTNPNCTLPAVPTGYRLIIETVSYLANSPSTSNLQNAVINIANGPGDGLLLPIIQSPSTATHIYGDTVRVVFFLPAGSSPHCAAFFDTSDLNTISCTVAGHLVAAP